MNGRAAKILRRKAESTYGKLLRAQAGTNRQELPPFKTFNRRFKRKFVSLPRPERAGILRVFSALRSISRSVSEAVRYNPAAALAAGPTPG